MLYCTAIDAILHRCYGCYITPPAMLYYIVVMGAILHRLGAILHRKRCYITPPTVDATGLFLLLLACHTACGQRPRAPGFLKLFWFARRYVCVCVCVSAPEAINNQWRDIDCVQLVKQVLRLFPAFNYFIRHLPSIKWMGVAILT